MEEKTLYILLCLVAMSLAISPEKLPPCPTNINYFPQNLPMHCRMARSISTNYGSTKVSSTPKTSSADKASSSLPFPFPPGPFPYPFPGAPPAPMPMPMPMPMPGPAHKLPVIVMPFYSPDPSYKPPEHDRSDRPRDHDHRRPRRLRRPRRPRITDSDTSSSTDTDCSDTDTDTDTSSDTSSDSSSDTSNLRDRGWWNHNKKPSKKSGRRSSTKKHSHKSKRKHKEKKELLTPVLQYVTKDGYVIFEKKISKGEAKDWLKMRNDDPDPNNGEIRDGAKENDGVVEVNENDKDEYDEKSMERNKKIEATTEKSRMHKKHRIKPNILIPSGGKN